MRIILNQKFFNRPTLKVARELLGKFLVARKGRKKIALMITETEAYDGPLDKASHASHGKTKRTEPMFGEAGHFYVYLVYGMYCMVNVVTGPKNYPAAVLIRSGKIKKSLPSQISIAEISEGEPNKKDLNFIMLNGPGKITKYLGITRKFSGLPAIKKTGLWFEDRSIKIKAGQIIAGKRIGVDYAKEWKDKPYNFRLIC
jgi:DNA-3-methyladenine glycosylase